MYDYEIDIVRRSMLGRGVGDRNHGHVVGWGLERASVILLVRQSDGEFGMLLDLERVR